MDRHSIDRFQDLSTNNVDQRDDSREIDRLWSALECPQFEVDTDCAWTKISTAISKTTTKRKAIYLGWASSVALVLGAAWFILTSFDDSQTLSFTSDPSSREILLPDNSEVILAEGSTMQVTFASDHREVALQGSAYFDVASDKNAPFVISLEDLSVTVLGTAFEVINTSEGFQVGVTEGYVSVKFNETEWNLSKGEGISIQASNRSFRRYEDVDFLDKSWENEQFAVADQQLQALLKTLSYKHDLVVTYSPREFKNCLISGKFDLSDLKQSLEQLSTAVGFSYELKNNQLYISGKGC